MENLKENIISRISEERARNVKDFFKFRQLSFDSILNTFKYQIDDYKHLLLTSSPVHGIANIKSDIDVICITTAPVPTPRMATQSFNEGNHYEIISFTTEELTQTLEFFYNLAEMPINNALEQIKTWNKNSVISKKYLERIINGVDIHFSTPYLNSLPQLGILWKYQSFEIFRQCAILTVLAEKAGENRGRAGYAMNSLMYLMDCILSHHGYAFSNKKWYLYRFKKFLTAKKYDPEFKDLAADIENLFQLLTHEIKDCKNPLAGRILDLYNSSRSLLGLSFTEEPLTRPNPSVKNMPFLKGSSLYYDGKQGAILCSDAPKDLKNDSFQDILHLDQPGAAVILAKIRAGILTITLSK